MKLLMISGDRSVLAGKRGAFWYTLEEFSKHWERIDVITPGENPVNLKIRSRKVFENVFFHPSPWPLRRQRSWIVKRGAELIAEQRHNVMTVHDYPPFYNGLGARMLNTVTGIPYALEFHGGVPLRIRGRSAVTLRERIGWRLTRSYLPWASRRASAVRVVNGTVRETLIHRGAPADKVFTVPSAYMDAATLQPDPSAEKRYDVGFCSRLVANKGVLEAIEALSLLPDATMLVIGDGPLRAEAEALVKRKGLTDRVTFVGWIADQREVVRLLGSCRTFLMNSLSEGGPRTALEAMALGLPVVATPVGILPDVIVHGENALQTDGSIQDIAHCLRMLLDDPARRERMSGLAVKVMEHFEKKRLVKGYADFLKSVAR